MRYLMIALCLLAPVLALAQDDAGELLKNPGFDVDENKDGLPDGWSCSDKVIRRQEIQAFGGNFEIVSLPGSYVLATQDVALKPGLQYNLTMRMRGEGGALGGALILHGATKPTREFSIVWNLEPGGTYENYIATFKAPDGVCRLYLYNVARKGTIYYDRVSLREGSPDQLIVQQLSIAKIDRPIGDPPVTEHIPYGRNLAGGPLKTFIALRSFRHMREVTELGERVDLDCDVLNAGYDGDETVSETGRRMMQRLDDNTYEVYLVGSRLGPAALKTIQARVQKGAGLVVLEGFGQAGKFLDVKQLTDAPADHYVLRGVPWDVMPQGIMTGMQTGQLGQGRVVRLNFPYTTCRVWGLIPIGLKYDDWIGRQWTYWDGWLSLVGRAMLWAARGPADSSPRRPAGPPAGAQVIYRSARELRFDGPNLRLAPQTVALDAQGRPQLQAPAELPAGPVLAEVMLRDKAGQTVDWTTQLMSTPQQARIVELQPESPTVKPGDPVKLTVKLAVDKPADVTVEGRLIDAFGRREAIGSLTQTGAAGEPTVTLVLPLARPLGVHHKAFVRVLVGGKEQDSRWAPVRVPELGPRLANADFLATPWGPGGFPSALGLLADRTRELGLNGEFAVNQYLAGEHGMLAAGYCSGAGAFREESHPGDVRKMCLSDPAVVEKYTTAAREAAELQAPDGPYAVGITDEAFLSYHNMRQELCFSPHCIARFQEWLQARYPSLDALNAQWGTSYKAWEEVRGAKTEEIRGQANFGRFVDFRTFMTDVWVDACKTITDAYHEVNPTIPMGHTNTFGCNPFNGNDYYKLATQSGFGWGQEYGEEIKSSGNKAIFDVWRSFVETPEAWRGRASAGPRDGGPAEAGSRDGGPAEARPLPFFNHGWVGYDRREVAAHYEPWWLALHGSRGVSYFATSAYDTPRGRSWALVYPTGCLTEYSAAVKETLADLRGGVGKLLMEYQRAQPRVAILWSHPSMLVSWCESKEDVAGDPLERDTSDSYASWFTSALNFRQHLNELQLDYQYVAPEQVIGGVERASRPPTGGTAGAGGTPALPDFRLLLLPFTIAASEGLVAKLEAYVQQGGVIVGDMRCLRTDEHGKPDASGSLKRLFGVTRGGEVGYAESKITFKQAGEGLDLTGQEMTVYGKESLTAAGATALAAHKTGEPAVLIMPHGKGLSVYLNFKLPQYDAMMRELLRQIVARAGVKREATVQAANGDVPPRAYELNTVSRGPITVYGFIRDFRRCEDTDPVVIHFGRKAHVFDVRARKYVGEVDRVQTALPPGETALYALLPYRVEGLGLNAPATVKAGAELVAQVNLVTSAKAGDHVMHVEVLDPQGRSVGCYASNELMPGGKATVRVPLALNDAQGQWTLRVREVLTGAQSEAKFAVQ